MSVIRTYHNKENPYLLINKKALQDNKLSLRARGLWALCLSYPDDWKFYVKHLVKECKEGRVSIYNAIEELIDNNYAIKMNYYEKSKDGKIRGGGVEYVFFEFKITAEEKMKFTEEFKKSFQHSGFWHSGNRDSRNRQLLNNEDNHVFNDTNNKESNIVTHDSIPPLISMLSTESIPFQEEKQDNTTQPKREVEYDDPNVHEILSLELQTLPYFRPDIVARWMLKFGPKTLLDTIKFFFQVKATQKKPIPKPEAWMEVALKKKYAEVDKSSQENKRFAENLKKTYNVRSLKINKRYCQDTDTGRDFYYYLPANVFKQNLIRTYGVGIP